MYIRIPATKYTKKIVLMGSMKHSPYISLSIGEPNAHGLLDVVLFFCWDKSTRKLITAFVDNVIAD